MLDLNEQPAVPAYELKLINGEVKSYDTLLISFALRALDAESDPGVIQELVNKIFKINVDAWQAMIILEDFTNFAEANLEEPLKKVFGRELFSTSSMASRPQSSENSNQESSSD